ncbi:MAG: glycosyltransferase family 4 protein [Cyclobacteriaceae bacterium]|nr:glycosyltransferase family 4 protein [Cyclobacteriaceae bacterium]
MKSILFADMHREGRSPSQRFRYEQYLPLLKQLGYEVTHSNLLNEWDDKQFYSQGQMLSKGWILLKCIFKRLADLLAANTYDFIFIQREAFMLGTSFFEKQLARSKAKIIFDFDDAIWLPQVSSGGANNHFLFLKKPKKTNQLISIANLVVAGNQYLANYARQFNPNVQIIPTTIDTDQYQPRERAPQSQINIGWSGSTSTVDHFTTILPALEAIKSKYGNRVKFSVIGDSRFRHSALDIQGKNWNLKSEVDDLLQFDIGIMPLPDDEWAKGKCGLKGLQYMALEIPTVMSPVGVNSEIINHGVNGLLALTSDEWIDRLSLLIDQEELRKQLGKMGRKTVVESYSVKSNSERFLDLFR